MRCFCDSKETFDLKVEADVASDPIWCNQCGSNLNVMEAPISDKLKEELEDWVVLYGKWINWDIDKLRPNGVEMENQHNTLGQQLTEKVKKEIGSKYQVGFSPSTSAKSYVGLDL